VNSTFLKFETAAHTWRDALPCGNGVLGALIFGRIVKERILLNHEALWSRGNTPPVPETSEYLTELRCLLEEGRFAEADRFIPSIWEKEGFTADPAHFMPGPDVQIEYHPEHPFEQYSATLDLRTGEGVVCWKENRYRLDRRAFVSRVNNVLVVRFSTENPEGLDVLFSLGKHDPLDSCEYGNFGGMGCPETKLIYSKNGMHLKAVSEDGTAYDAELRIYGTAPIPEKNGLRVKGCMSVTVLVGLTPLCNSLRVIRPKFPESICYETMRSAHAALHAELMDRVTFSLSPTPDDSNERMLLDAMQGRLSHALTEKLFYYGRYLLISSSSGQAVYPAHLQGIWNGDYKPAWTCGLFNNENVQMNYWAALAGNLHEALLPMFYAFESLTDHFRENAQRMYGCRGFLIPLFMNPRSGRKHNPQPHAVYWTAGGGWISQHFYDYSLYTGDEEFLRKRALPFMQEAAQFYEDFFKEGANGFWVSAPSQSPENHPLGNFVESGKIWVCVDSTMDFAVAKELFTNLIEASVRLGINEGHLPRWKAFIEKIPPYRLNGDGAIAEWIDPRFLDNYHHRHMSHLYGLFPGREICPVRRPDLFAACRTAVEKRLLIGIEQQTGWSFAHMAAVYARLGKGSRSLECIRLLARSCLGKNFFTYHNSDLEMGITQSLIQGMPAPFQIDANLGITAAVLEMLLFSRPGFIHLLPALPAEWTEGTASGICAVGGVSADIEWNLSDARARLTAKKETELSVKFEGDLQLEKILLRPDTPLTLTFNRKGKLNERD